MRKNPARVLAAIQSITESHPELRVGQIICIAMRNNERKLDLFNVEDDELAHLLGQVFKGQGSANSG